MLNRPDRTIRERLVKLETHLQNENPLLLDAISLFKKLDRIAYQIGLLDTSDSYATRIPWWPLVSVLGTFSAGKSSFINQFLGSKLQSSGNQAVDDKFTVICYSTGEDGRVLPGRALDSDPRFPFYQMSRDIEKVAPGEGKRIDAYVQMKTSNSDSVSGKIIIDSPGFDADDQRNAILRLTDHIIGLSDLVLVFFDARHPEPGAMQDTLDHLVANTIKRNDSEKFLYVLNQIDTAAREDNPEDVVAAWQRALAHRGLTAGRFYSIYNKEVAVPIEDEAVRKRFESKRDTDLAAIHGRIHQVEVERSYRIIGALENITHDIERVAVPRLNEVKKRWMLFVLGLDAAAFVLVMLLLFLVSYLFSPWGLFRFDFATSPEISSLKMMVIISASLLVHFSARNYVAKRLARKLSTSEIAGNIRNAFMKNTVPFRSVFQPLTTGWTENAKLVLTEVLNDASALIQRMNDRYTNPSGDNKPPPNADVTSTDLISADVISVVDTNRS